MKDYIVNKASRNCKCRASKHACPYNNLIEKGTIRLGTNAEICGGDTTLWRHIGCVTQNMFAKKGITMENFDTYVDIPVLIDFKDKTQTFAARCAALKNRKKNKKALLTIDEAAEIKTQLLNLVDTTDASAKEEHASISSKTSGKKRTASDAELAETEPDRKR